MQIRLEGLYLINLRVATNHMHVEVGFAAFDQEGDVVGVEIGAACVVLQGPLVELLLVAVVAFLLLAPRRLLLHRLAQTGRGWNPWLGHLIARTIDARRAGGSIEDSLLDDLSV